MATKQTNQSIRQKLKALREKHAVPMKDLAVAVSGRKNAALSAWQYFETRLTKPYFPADKAERVAPIFERHGCDPAEIWALVLPEDRVLSEAERVAVTGSEDDIAEALADVLHQAAPKLGAAKQSELIAAFLKRLRSARR